MHIIYNNHLQLCLTAVLVLLAFSAYLRAPCAPCTRRNNSVFTHQPACCYFRAAFIYSLTCDQAFFFFAAEGGRKKKESLIQLLVESSAAPQLKCLSTRVSAMPSDKSEPITIYRKSLRRRESAEARSGHEVCKHLCKLPFVSRPIRKKSRFWTFYRRLDK